MDWDQVRSYSRLQCLATCSMFWDETRVAEVRWPTVAPL